MKGPIVWTTIGPFTNPGRKSESSQGITVPAWPLSPESPFDESDNIESPPTDQGKFLAESMSRLSFRSTRTEGEHVYARGDYT